MGCNSDYMNPTTKERELRETAVLYDFALRQVYGENVKPCNKLASALNTSYPNEDLTAELCTLLRGLDLKTFESLVYNAREPQSRRLADWWERHLAADEQRIKQEIEKKFKADPVVSQFIGLGSKFLKANPNSNKAIEDTMGRLISQHSPAVERKAKALAHAPFFQLKDALDVYGGYRPGHTALNYSYKRSMEFGMSMGHNTMEKPLDSTQGMAALENLPRSVKSSQSDGHFFIRTYWAEVLKCCEASGVNAKLAYCHDGGGMESWYELTLTVPAG